MAAAGQSPAQRELSLVGKVEMRIALADTDAKLTSTLNTYLAPLLLKLSSEHVDVRNKVISVCQHINTRIKPESIQLPVAALIQQFKEQHTPLIRHFDLLYIQQGLDRLTSSQKNELLPAVTAGFASSGTHAPQIFNLLLRLLEFFTLPPRGSKDDLELRTTVGVTDEDAKVLLAWLGKLLLFNPSRASGLAQAGLSKSDTDFLSFSNKPDAWIPAKGGLNVLRTKILAARLVASGMFTDGEKFVPALFAAADSASTISDIGEDVLKRSLPATDLEDANVLGSLFRLHLGDESTPRASVPLRTRILSLLLKSTASASYADEIVKITDDGTAPAEHDGEDAVMSNGTSRPAPDRQAVKLRAAVFEYINFVARYAPADVLHTIAPGIVSKLKDFVENQGWPKPGQNEDISTRAYAYEVLGLLLKAGPLSLIFENEHPTADLLRWLFTSLAQDSSGTTIVVSIEQALSTVLGSLSRAELGKQQQTTLEDLLMEQMILSNDLEKNKRLRSTRYAALRFANRCLPFNSIKARCIDLLGMSAIGERMEVKEESERGLSPYWYQMLKGATTIIEQKAIKLPSFVNMVPELLARYNDARSAEELVRSKLFATTTAQKSLLPITTFLRRVIYYEALSTTSSAPVFSSEWERNLDAIVENDASVRAVVRTHMQVLYSSSPEALKLYQLALLQNVLERSALEEDCFIQHLSLASDELVADLMPHVALLLPVILSNDHRARLVAAHAFGILASHPAAEKIKNIIDDLTTRYKTWDTALGAQVNQVQGAVLSLAYYYSRKRYRGEDDDCIEACNLLATDLTTNMVAQVKDLTIRKAVFVAIGQLALYNAIDAGFESFRICVDKVFDTAKTGDERAILCLGQLSMICDDTSGDDSDLNYLEKRLHELHEVRQAEIHFTVGEAFTYLTCGWQSGALSTKQDIDGALPTSKDRSGVLARLTARFASDCTNTKPALKKAAVMWLLCLVQYCGHLPELQAMLPQCQLAFKRCLVDRDDLVQETASRGLGLVYEKGDRSLKDDLVRDLVSSFSSDRSTSLAGTVSADTQLFEPGALPTGDGSVSTYKDIMSLASEVGDSSLVYRFMSMASSNAIWSSRAAFGRFGLSNVLSDASVDGYLANNPKLYPKLYRYRFDPNTGIRRSMNDIWNALVKDSAGTIDAHFEAIIADLLVSILGKEWRVRQASCAALADLLQGRSIEKYEQHLEDVWDKCFKVLDDIKESVRAAAASLARTLTGILTRALEADHSTTKAASAMLKHVLPFLLSPAGLESSAKEVQLFAVHTLLEIINKANAKTLRPFIPELVERLIALLSSMEHEAVNYIHLNASKYNLTEQKIDDMRLSSVRSSPLMEAIERCLDLLDDDTMQLLRPRLEHAMKSAVGLPSKVGASRVLVSLCTRQTQVFKPHAGHFLKIIEKYVSDRNETVSSSYAASAGYVARHASDASILALIAFAQRLYFHAEGDREGSLPRKSISSGEIVYAVAKQASDRFGALAASVLPFVFVAKHDSHDAVKEQFQNTWSEAVGGSRAIQLYLREIVSIIGENLDSAQWTLKHTAARSVADATTTIIASDKHLSADTAAVLWPVLDKALGGKTWDGKEAVLDALVKFVGSAGSFYEQDPKIASSISKIAIREAKRNNKEYRPHALHAAAQIASMREDDAVLSSELHQVVAKLLEELESEDTMDVDGEDDKSSKENEVLDKTLAAAMECMLATINAWQLTDRDQLQTIGLEQAVKIKRTSAVVQRSTFQAMAEMFSRFKKRGTGHKVTSAKLADLVRQLLFEHEVGSEALRLLRAECLNEIAAASPKLAVALRAEVELAVRLERSMMVRDRLAASLGAAAGVAQHG